MRKFLDQKIWSHGTSLGYLGSKSQADVGLGACRLQFLVIWGPSELPVPMKFHANAKNLKTAGSRCGSEATYTIFGRECGHCYIECGHFGKKAAPMMHSACTHTLPSFLRGWVASQATETCTDHFFFLAGLPFDHILHN